MSAVTEKCVVCMEEMKNDASTKLECGHEFHVQCVLDWFRADDKRCPMCRAFPKHNKELKYRPPSDADRIALILELAKGKKAPAVLKNYVSMHNNVQNRVHDAQEKWRAWANTKDCDKYYALQNKHAALQAEVEASRERLREVERALLTLPLPIIFEQPIRRKRKVPD